MSHSLAAGTHAGTLLPGASSMPLPSSWQAPVDAELAAQEKIVAWFEIDLDRELRFSPGLVVVTDRRVLARSADEASWQSHAFRPGLRLSRRDHSGVGSLELFDATRRLALWRYTLGADVACGRLIDIFDRQLAFFVTGEVPAAPPTALCPKCETPLLAGQEDCPQCSKEILSPPST